MRGTPSTVWTRAYPAPFRGSRRLLDAPQLQEPGEPPATALDGEIPKGYPPAFLLSGTRDMCLSQTVLLHRKLRNAGVEADLNVFEGM
jgi:acetyl esterase/lipase